MSTKKTLQFEASAYLQRLIGRDLVPNEEMAIVELVKNSYDSGATQVNIFIQPDSEKKPGYIRIADDGSGMSIDDIRSNFMFAGYSDRPDQTRRVRVPTGEKGIGRFAADKLGRTLEVFTRQRRQNEGIRLRIDWRAFEARAKAFNQIHAEYTVGPVPQVLNQHGTTLEIGRLRTQWTSAKLDSLRNWLKDLFDPFRPPKDFSVTLELAGTRSARETIEPEVPEADLVMDVALDEAHKLRRRIKSLGDNITLIDERSSEGKHIESLGALRARFLYFHKRPNKKLARGLEPGVRVYRDGFRIEPFGSRDADWLGIAEKRAKRAGHAHIVPSRLFGFVEISRLSNPELADTTSRQALLSTPAASSMVTLLRRQLDSFEEHLRSSRAEPRWKENRRVKAIAFEQARLHTLGVVSYGLAHELRQPMQAIRTEANNIRKKLVALGVKDEDITDAQRAIDRGVERIDKNIAFVSDIAKGSIEEKAVVDLVKVIRAEVEFLKPRCKAAGISLVLEAPPSQAATLNEFVVNVVIVNFIQNSMDALGSEGGNIRVIVRKKRQNHYVEVVDDGPGVSAEISERLFKQFTTQKTGGMGVGLSYCKAIVQSHGGSVGFDSKVKKGARFWMLLPEE